MTSLHTCLMFATGGLVGTSWMSVLYSDSRAETILHSLVTFAAFVAVVYIASH